MKKIVACGMFLFGLFIFPVCVIAVSQEEVRVKAEIDKGFLTIGDPVTYTVTVEHAPDIQILSGFPAPAADMLEVKSSEEIHTKNKKDLVTGRKFVLAPFKVGEFVLDPVTVEYRKAGQPIKTLQTNKLYLTVRSSMAANETAEDIRDVKSVVPFLWRFWKYVWLVLGAAAILLGGWSYRKWRERSRSSAHGEPVLTAEGEAFLHLRELFESDLLKRGLVKVYYLRLSEILRSYFEKRYSMLAVESTTIEILRVLRERDLDKALFEKIQFVLEKSDLAKFAKWVPTAPEVLQINRSAEEIIREAAPPPPVLTSSGTEVSHGV